MKEEGDGRKKYGWKEGRGGRYIDVKRNVVVGKRGRDGRKKEMVEGRRWREEMRMAGGRRWIEREECQEEGDGGKKFGCDEEKDGGKRWGWKEERDKDGGRNGNSKESYGCQQGEGDCGTRYARRTETMGKGRNVRRKEMTGI